jgi:F-type H+-transporting ATPase subunit alpha
VYAGVRGFLDKMMTSEISKFESKFLDHIRTIHPALLNRIKTYIYTHTYISILYILYYSTGELTKADDNELKSILEVFIPESGLLMKS